jgi:twinkle protein
MNYTTARELTKETDHLFENGIDKGAYPGFKGLSELYNVKKGCTTYVGGIPSHGKSTVLMEILMSLSELHEWKHAMFSPETGTPSDIIAELAHKYIRKSFDKGPYQMTIKEKYAADAFLSEYFYIMTPPENKMSVEDLLSIALEIKQKHGLDSFSIDPFNELSHNYDKHGGREDKYLEYILGRLRRFAREHDVHVFVVAHPRTLRPVDGVYLPPTAFELSGGAAWYAKAETILCVHRPDQTSAKVEIHVQKAKPKQIGRKGMVELYWDWQKSRYYERSLSGMEIYSSAKEIVRPGSAMTAIKEVNYRNTSENSSDPLIPF